MGVSGLLLAGSKRRRAAGMPILDMPIHIQPNPQLHTLAGALYDLSWLMYRSLTRSAVNNCPSPRRTSTGSRDGERAHKGGSGSALGLGSAWRTSQSIAGRERKSEGEQPMDHSGCDSPNSHFGHPVLPAPERALACLPVPAVWGRTVTRRRDIFGEWWVKRRRWAGVVSPTSVSGQAPCVFLRRG